MDATGSPYVLRLDAGGNINKVQGIKIINPVMDLRGYTTSSSWLYANNCAVQVIQPQIWWGATSYSQAPMLLKAGAEVHVFGGCMDFSTNTAYVPTCALVTSTTNVQYYVRDTEYVVNHINCLTDVASATNCSIFHENVKLSTSASSNFNNDTQGFASGYRNENGTGNYIGISWKAGWGLSGTQQGIIETSKKLTDGVFSTASANVTIHTDYRTDDILYYSTTCTATGVTINNIDKGLFDGQELLIRSYSGSTQSFTISSSGTNLKLASSVTVAAKGRQRLRWDATEAAWVEAA
jgi:hypothetical protein